MSEQFRDKTASVASQATPDVLGLLKKIQEQLFSLERKIDGMSSRPQERSFNKERSFSKPFRSYGPPRHASGDREYSPRKREFDQPRSFKKRPSDQSRRYDPKKKPFFQKRKERD